MPQLVDVRGGRDAEQTGDTVRVDVNAILITDETQMTYSLHAQVALRLFELQPVRDGKSEQLLEFFTKFISVIRAKTDIIVVRDDIHEPVRCEKLLKFFLSMSRAVAQSEGNSGPAKLLSPRDDESGEVSVLFFNLKLMKEGRTIQRTEVTLARELVELLLGLWNCEGERNRLLILKHVINAEP